MLVRSVRCDWATTSWSGSTMAAYWRGRWTIPLHSRVCRPHHICRSASQVPSKNHVTAEHSISPNVNNVRANHTRTLVLLRKTISFLPRVSLGVESQGRLNSPAFWCDLLESTNATLSSGPTAASPTACISVCGIGEISGAQELVTAMLDDPFSDPAHSAILRNRWENRPNIIMVEYGLSTMLEHSSEVRKLNSPSAWLLQYPYDIQLFELPTLDSISEANVKATQLLWTSDILVLVCDPLLVPIVTLAARAKRLLNRPNTILVFTSVAPSAHRRSQVSEELSNLGCEPGRILFLDPVQAVRATAGLQTNSDFSLAVERYQNASLSSRVSSLGTAVGELLGGRESTDGSLSSLHTQTALVQIQSALDAGGESLACTAERISQVFTGLAKLRSEVADVRERAEKEVLGGSSDVESVLAQDTKRMKAMLESLSFWNMVWAVDEIEAIVNAPIRLDWCKELEDELILQTGRLSCAQDRLCKSTFDLLSTLVPPSPYSSLHSPLLHNRLQQLASAPSYALTSAMLTLPVRDRRAQLTKYCTSQLHREAQSTVAGAFIGVLGGAGVSWWLAIGSHILSFGPGAEIASAIGVGAIVAVGSLRWAVGKWERAKRKWIQDLERVSDGTKRDLKASLQHTINQNVVIVAETACQRLEKLASKGQEEVEAVEAELHALQIELGSCTISRLRKPLQ
ncbi:hypothetical protein EDC04DRAFT_1532265 [Pisolithus marmoratus]|nr:hypothetical protein EDC04DRAFT_1532265 [Pisolithus marmoratus]